MNIILYKQLNSKHLSDVLGHLYSGGGYNTVTRWLETYAENHPPIPLRGGGGTCNASETVITQNCIGILQTLKDGMVRMKNNFKHIKKVQHAV